jgi:hypothetical protein
LLQVTYKLSIWRQCWLCMPVLVWFIFRKLSQRGVRLPVSWFNAEWDSTSTELTQKSPTFTKISAFRVDSVTWSLTPRWLSQHGVSPGVDSVDGEWDSALSESPPNVKKIWKSRRIQVQNRKPSKVLLFGLCLFDMCKKPDQKISCKCTFKVMIILQSIELPLGLKYKKSERYRYIMKVKVYRWLIRILEQVGKR